MAIAKSNIAEMRVEYARLRDNATYTFPKGEWEAAVRELADALADRPGEPAPRDWLLAARSASLPCPRCKGAGLYASGPPKRAGGFATIACDRCGGRGEQTQADSARNRDRDAARSEF